MAIPIPLKRLLATALSALAALHAAGCTNLVISDPSQLPRAASDFVYPGYQAPGKNSNTSATGSMQGMQGMDSKNAAGDPAGHDMSTMQDMPGIAPKPAGAPEPKPAAGAHDMSAMQGMPGMESKPGTTPTPTPKPKPAAGAHDMSAMQGMPGMESKPNKPPKPKPAAVDHDMNSMQGMPRMAAKTEAAPKAHTADGHGHHEGATQATPSIASGSGSLGPTTPKSEAGHDTQTMQTMPGMERNPGKSPEGPITGTGVVKGIDKANGRMTITHDPIAATEWPKMTVTFRLKDNSLADRVRQGERAAFTLEKSSSGYVISDLQKSGGTR